jgi:hypothetical protein
MFLLLIFGYETYTIGIFSSDAAFILNYIDIHLLDQKLKGGDQT